MRAMCRVQLKDRIRAEVLLMLGMNETTTQVAMANTFTSTTAQVNMATLSC